MTILVSGKVEFLVVVLILVAVHVRFTATDTTHLVK